MNDKACLSHSQTFPERLIYYRRKFGLSQQALAERLGLVSAETISRYERGAREPRISTLIALADALGISPRCLVPESDIPEMKTEWADSVFKILTGEAGMHTLEAEYALNVLVIARRGMASLGDGAYIAAPDYENDPW